MREILFRGKRVDNGEWVYGGIATTAVNHNVVIVGEDRNTFYGIYPWHVDYRTAGQYTGLKDRNGVMIFDGDIVEFIDYHHREHYTERGAVEWIQERAKWGIVGLNPDLDFSGVIGNIHENPELLEQGAVCTQE